MKIIVKKKDGDALFVIGILILTALGIYWIATPYFQPNPFNTFYKISDIYDDPIYMKFHWVTDNELQVGKPIKLSVEIRELPYTNQSKPIPNIEIRFNENELNYLHVDEGRLGNKIYEKDYLTFKRGSENNVFISEPIGIRFIVPTDISVDFCDSTLDPECTKIKNIIHPAPHDLAVQILTNQIGIALSFVIVGFSGVMIWLNFRKEMTD